MTTVRTLTSVPNSFFTKMLGRFANEVKTHARPLLFVDRSPQVLLYLFHHFCTTRHMPHTVV